MDKWTEADDGFRAMAELLHRMNRAHRRVVERRVSELGIHGGQHRLLMDLAREGRVSAQTELARCLDVSPASVANMLKKLESGGYIERSVHNADGRRNEVTITEAGNRVVERSRGIFEDVDRRMFEGFTQSEAEVMRACLGKIHRNLRRMEEELDGAQTGSARPAEERNDTRH